MWNIQNDRITMALTMMMSNRPMLVWDFHSLLLGIQMMFTFMLTDEEKPLRLCKHCMKDFVASRPGAVFCSPRCKSQYNVYKNRVKKNNPDGEEQDDD